MKDLYDMRGPELIHNKLQFGEFGIQVWITYPPSKYNLHPYEAGCKTIEEEETKDHSCLMTTCHVSSFVHMNFLADQPFKGHPLS